MYSDTENYIIASWLIGDHRNDLQFVLPHDFHYGNNPDIVRMLKADRGNDEICSKYRDDYIVLMDSYMPSVYEAAFAKAIDDVKRRWVASHAPINDILGMMHILNDRINGLVSVPIIQRNLLEIWESAKDELRNNGQCEYGIGKLDYLTGGIFKGHLITLAARPGGCKSTLALQIASHIALHEKKKVIYFTLEMSITEQLDRLLMQRVGVQDPNRLKQGDLTLEEISAFRDMIEEVERNRMLLFSTERIMERIESTIAEESPFLIVIDQLTQLQFGNRFFPNDLERYKALTRHLKKLTNTTGVTILLLCQLNRLAEGKEPELSHLKDSGSIEEDSDDVLMIYKSPEDGEYEVANPSEPSFRNIKIAKQRSGTTGRVLNLTFDPLSMTMFEYKSVVSN